MLVNDRFQGTKKKKIQDVFRRKKMVYFQEFFFFLMTFWVGKDQKGDFLKICYRGQRGGQNIF